MIRRLRSLGPAGLLAGCLFLALAAALWLLPLRHWLDAAVLWIQAHPAGGRGLFLLLFVAGAVAMVPGSLLVMSGGFLFGLIDGVLLVSLAVTLGATAALLIGRRLGRRRIGGWLEHRPRLAALDAAVAERGFLVVLLTRLSMAIPYNLLNYAFALSRVSLPAYVLGTGIGMLPAVLLYVYLGTLARNLDALLAAGGDAGEAAPWLLVAGLTLILAVVWILQRTASRLLAQAAGDRA
ncbi:MAG: TVP38/TMEM64 family protein [Gammaproteobacteria bacterium]|nr:MAG: TVP38/TMEM64 family protein [Gammaproteobacteria bacterium]